MDATVSSIVADVKGSLIRITHGCSIGAPATRSDVSTRQVRESARDRIVIINVIILSLIGHADTTLFISIKSVVIPVQVSFHAPPGILLVESAPIATIVEPFIITAVLSATVGWLLQEPAHTTLFISIKSVFVPVQVSFHAPRGILLVESAPIAIIVEPFMITAVLSATIGWLL